MVRVTVLATREPPLCRIDSPLLPIHVALLMSLYVYQTYSQDSMKLRLDLPLVVLAFGV